MANWLELITCRIIVTLENFKILTNTSGTVPGQPKLYYSNAVQPLRKIMFDRMISFIRIFLYLHFQTFYMMPIFFFIRICVQTVIFLLCYVLVYINVSQWQRLFCSKNQKSHWYYFIHIVSQVLTIVFNQFLDVSITCLLDILSKS